MNIPNFVDSQIVDKDGFLTPSWQQFFTQLVLTLQQNAGTEGVVMPTVTDPQNSLLTNSQLGTVIYNKDQNVLRVYLE